jgi:hypothetical protein
MITYLFTFGKFKREYLAVARARVVWGKGDYKKYFGPAARRKNPFRPAGGQKEKGVWGK